MRPTILILEINLPETSPPIWRIVEVKQSSTLHELHAVIQVAMGWENAHLYSFSKGQGKNAMEFMLPEYDESNELYTGNNPRDFKLKDLFRDAGDQILYTYDWGDNWEHRVVMKGRRYEKAMFGFPTCVAGSGCCPPEDCGGAPGFMELLNAIETKNKSALKDYDQWLGYRFDLYDFDPEELQIFFGKEARRIAKI